MTKKFKTVTAMLKADGSKLEIVTRKTYFWGLINFESSHSVDRKEFELMYYNKHGIFPNYKLYDRLTQSQETRGRHEKV